MMRNLARPTRLSDPGGDFVDEEELRSILATPDKQMAFYEFNCLFQGRLPAGTYGEVIYFFPMMMNYLLEERDGWDTLFINVMVWLNEYAEELRNDGRWEATLERLNAQTEAKINAPFRLRRYTDKHHDSRFWPNGIDWFWALDDAIDTCQSIYEETCPVLAGTEALLLKRFEAITSYDVAAWFVYLTKQCPHLPCLKQLGAEGDRMARAEALIVEETLRNPLHLRFWDRELATYY